MIPNKQKVIFVLLLAFILPATALAYAYDFCVDGIYYSRSGVNAAVTCYTTGTNSYSGDVVIPSSVTYGGTTYAVTSISYYAFKDCKDLTSVTIPSSVTSIGSYAFKDCTGLMSVTIPNSVISIDEHAFEGCNGIISLNIGTSVTSVGDYAFKGCSGITSMTLPNSITTIGEYAFNACVSLTSVTVPNSVTTIGAGAFYDCTSLANINVSNSVMNIGLNAFDGTSWYNNQPDGLVYAGPVAYRYKGTMTDGTSINIKEGTLYIAEEAFKGCSGLLSINIPNSVTSIGDYAFSGCTSLSSLNVPNSVSFIGLDAFDGTSWYNNQPDGLVYAGPVAYKYKGIMPDGTSISIKEGTLCITSSAFQGCNGMTSVTIPNTVTTIGNYAFQYCSGLTIVTIPNSVTSIGNRAFQGCTSLETLNYKAASCEDFSLSSLPFYYLNISTINFGDSVQRIPEFFAYNLTKLTSVTIPYSVNTIGGSAFSCCNGLTEVNIGNSVTTIGGYVFSGCSGLTTVTIPSSVTSIGKNVFGECGNLVSLVVESGNSVFDSRDNCNAIIESESHTLIAGCQNTVVPITVTSIGDYAFYGCNGLTDFTIPNYVTSIGEFAFYRCIGLTGNLDLPNSITSIGGYAFSGCSGLTSVTVSNTVKFLGVSVFSYCNGLTNASINSTAIGIDSFYACSGLKKATIGTSVTSIGDFAFQNCSALDTLYFNAISCEDFSSNSMYESLLPFHGLNFSTIIIGNSVVRIPAYFAYNSTQLKNVTIGNSVRIIGKLAFNRCRNLTNIYLPNSVIVIDDGAFSVCGGLTSLTIPDSVTTIGVNAFNSCVGLTSVTIGNSVKTIGSSAFSSCSALSGSLTIPNSVTSIGHGAFSGCTALDTLYFNAASCADFNYGPFSNLNISTIIFGDSVERIPSYFAWGLAKISCVTIGRSVTSIGNSAFKDCTALDTLYFNAVSCADFNSTGSLHPFYNLNISTINFGNDVERIPAYFADGLTKLSSITIGNSVNTIGFSAFLDCSGLSGSLTIPNSVTCIGDLAFFHCAGLTCLTIGNSVTSIGSSAFSGCTGLPCLSIPNSVTSIGNGAFSDCSGLKCLTISNSVTSIGYSAFSGCTSLDTLNFNAVSCADFSSTASYRPFNNLSISTINIGNDVERIPAYFACGLTNLKVLTIDTSVTSIGNYAFQGCTALDTLYFNAVSCADFSSSTSSPFYNLNLSTINIGNDVERIPAYFAYGLTKLTDLTFGKSVTAIGSSAFQNCTGFTCVTIGNTVTTIEKGAFYGCSGLTNVKIPNSVISIGNYAFWGCTGLICATIGNSVTRIGDYAFKGCTGLTSLTIGNSVTSIGNYAFQGCTALDMLYFNAISCPDFSSTASYRPFNNLSISTINIGNDVERIPAYFAYGLTKLTDLTIGTSVTSIGNYSFYNCTKLASVTSLRPEAVSLPLNAFSNSTYSNATLTVPVGSYNSYKQTNYWNRFYGINESTSVDSIVLNFTDLSLYVGESVRLSAVIIPDDANQQVTWSTSNSSIVSVESDGTVTGLKAGTATITATSCDGSGRTACCLITVLANCQAYLDTLTHIRGEAAELVEVPISFYNRNAISAIQFDVSLPGCASFGYPVMRVEDSRLTNSHSFSYNKLNDKSYRVLIASPSLAALNGNDGPLVYLNVMLSKAVETAGDYHISVSNIIAAEPDETRHVLDNVNGVVRYYYIVGDVDADLSVDIADYMATASKILARSPSPFYSDAADVDENSSINVTDLVGITNISLGIKPITLRYAPRRGTGLDLLTCEPLVIAADQERSITLNLEAGFDFAAFQMDLSLPQGLTLVGAELGGEASRLQLTWATLLDGNVRLLSSSFSDVDVQGDCPGLLTLKVKAEDDFGGYHSSIGLSNITFAERNLASHEFDDMDIECYSSTAVSELDDATRIFVEEGHIIVETPVDGTVVVSDISGHIREYPVFAGHNEITPWCNGVMMIRYNNQTLIINLKR